MAGLTPTLGIVSTLAQSASILQNTFGGSDAERSEDLALQQLQQRQNEELRQAQQNAALEREQLALNAKQAEEERQRALRRAVARQRAQFGGSGISSVGGSAEAVLLGLVNESEEERTRREELDTLRNRAIDQDLGQQQRLNVLQRTQLEERSRVNNLSGTLNNLSQISGFLA